MSPQRPFQPLPILLMTVAFAPPALLLASIPWLKQQPKEVSLLLAAAASICCVAASFGLAILSDRKSDQWQRSGARFSTQWGWTAGSCLIAVLLGLPPAQDLIVSLISSVTGARGANRELILFTFTMGFMATVLTQTLCTFVAGMGWHAWMSRGPRDPS